MVPNGGQTAALSTNPIGIAIPGTEPMFVLDIATSERSVGYLSMAKSTGESIPPSWAVDKEGRPTSNPNIAVAVLPFGGYKGFALSLAFEILSGALVGTPIGQNGQLGSPRRFGLFDSSDCFWSFNRIV